MKRDGFILISVLVVVLLSSMVAVSLIYRLRAEQTASTASIRSEQAWAAALSGVQEALRVLSESTPDNPIWLDNPGAFQQRLLIDDGADQWYFTVFSIDAGDIEAIRHGLTDEAAKLNVNHATEAMLEAIPQLTTPLIHALLDYIDADSEPREEGAEQDYYDGLPVPYSIRNAPLATLGELLLVRGFTPALVYGSPNQRNTDLLFANPDSSAQAPLSHYLTVWSYDSNQSSEKTPRVHLNDPEDDLGETGLPGAVIEFIEALRREEIWINHPADLLDAVLITENEDGTETETESGVGPEELAILLDRCTATYSESLPGRINVNTASATVLQTLPGIDDSLADAIVSARPGLGAEQRGTPAWLYQEDILTAEQFRLLAPHVTSRSHQFSFRVVGFGIPSGRYRVVEVVVDSAPAQPAILYLRDLTRQGLPFPIEPQPGPFADAGRTTVRLATHYRNSTNDPPCIAPRTVSLAHRRMANLVGGPAQPPARALPNSRPQQEVPHG